MPAKAMMTAAAMSMPFGGRRMRLRRLPRRRCVTKLMAGACSLFLGAEDRLKPLLEPVRPSQYVGNADPAADDGEHGQDDERYGHHLRGLVDVVLHLLGRPAFAVEGLEEHPEHVEGGQTGGDGTDDPEDEAAARSWRRPSTGSRPC